MGSIRALLPTSCPADVSQRRSVCPLVTEGTVDWRRPELDDGTHWVPTGLDRHFPQLGEPSPPAWTEVHGASGTVPLFSAHMETAGIEPATSALQTQRSPAELRPRTPRAPIVASRLGGSTAAHWTLLVGSSAL